MPRTIPNLERSFRYLLAWAPVVAAPTILHAQRPVADAQSGVVLGAVKDEMIKRRVGDRQSLDGVATLNEFFNLLGKAATKRAPQGPSEREPGKR